MGVEKQISRVKELAEAKERNKDEIYHLEKGLVEHILLMEEILHSIPEAIGVIRPDCSVAFFNQAGYELFGKSRDEMRQINCMELFHEAGDMDTNIVDWILKEKKDYTCQIFSKFFNKHLELFFKPILDKDFQINLIILKIRDISQQKIFEEKLQTQEKAYRRLFESSPYGIVVMQDGKIIMHNSEMIKLLGYREEELEELDLLSIVDKDYSQRARKAFSNLHYGGLLKVETDLVLFRKDDKKIFTNITANKLDFLGKEAIQLTIRDTSLIRAEMDKASKIQKVRMEKYPVDLERINFQTVYLPKQIVSGDFFHIFRTGKDEMLGFLGDSNGSGVSAALLNSAVKVIINYVITKTTNPEEFLEMLDDEFNNLFEEDFVSAICFKIDFKEEKIIITSAGINEYIIERKGSPTQSLLKGPPIGGKLENLAFDTIVHDFQSGDRIYLFTDGFDSKIQNQYFADKVFRLDMEGQKEYIKDYFAKPDNISDDVLWVGIESL